jgi:hypothetical protein
VDIYDKIIAGAGLIRNTDYEKTIKERDMYKSRCKDLEDSLEQGYGIKIRNEITEIVTPFDKTEIAVLHASVCILMTKKLNTNDLQYYLTLRLKLEQLLNDMKG